MAEDEAYGPDAAAGEGHSDDGTAAAADPALSDYEATAPSTDALPGREVIESPLLESLAAEAMAGDHRARDRLLSEIRPMVLRYCRTRLGRGETMTGSADDVAQEVCIAVISSLPHYQIKGLSFRAFVYGIAAQKVTDGFRAIGRNRVEPVAELPDTPVLDDGPEHRLLAVELTERLGGLLQYLTPRQRLHASVRCWCCASSSACPRRRSHGWSGPPPERCASRSTVRSANSGA